MKKIEFIQLSPIFWTDIPNLNIVIEELEDGKTIGYFTVKVPKTFPEYKLNPFLLN
jgi:hypothetical protein